MSPPLPVVGPQLAADDLLGLFELKSFFENALEFFFFFF